MNPTDTPRTDAAVGFIDYDADFFLHPSGNLVEAKFAQQLERELAAMKIRAEQAETDLYLLGERHRRLVDSMGC